MFWYKIQDNVVTMLPGPTDNTSVGEVAFSNSGIYLATGSKTFKRNLLTIDNLNTVGTYGYGSAWSQNDYYFAALGRDILHVFTRSGDTFTSLADITAPGQAEALDISPDGNLYVVGHFNTPYLTTYLRSGSTFSTLTTGQPSGGWVVVDCKFSPMGDFFAVANGMTTQNLLMYSVSGNTFTHLFTESTGFSIRSMAWSSNSVYLAVTMNFAAVTIYKRTGNTLTKLNYPSTDLAGNGSGVAFTKDDKYLIVGHENSPFVTVYSRSGDVFTKLANPASLPTAYVKAVSTTYSL